MPFPILSRWTLHYTPTDKLILSHSPSKYGYLLIYIYLYYTSPYLSLFPKIRLRSADAWASGITFFYGCTILALDYSHWRDLLPSVADYNLLYLLVDHYIDDISLSGTSKHQIISQMKNILAHSPLNNTSDIPDPTLKAIAEIYSRLHRKHPAVHVEIVKLFEIEVRSLHIQHESSHSFETYYELACAKGGQTLRVLQSLLDPHDEQKYQSMYQLGIIMQLLDDCLDISSDLTSKIHTIATYIYQRDGNLDKLVSHIIKLIDSLPNEYNMFKIIYSVFVAYLPDRFPKYFSSELRQEMTSHNAFCAEFDGANFLTAIIEPFIPV